MSETLQTRCCVVGGGPAGIMAGYLLARAGVDTVVLEKHADFFRDFRGDTIHPSTLEIIHELGLLEEFLQLPHQETHSLQAQIGETSIPVADFSHLPVRCRFIAFMPQWDFLNFMASHARRLPCFRLRMDAEVVDLLSEAGDVTGARAKTPEGDLLVKSDLVIGADGRSSTVRAQAGLPTLDLGAPIDVLWFRISKRGGDPQQSLARVGAGYFLALIDRGEYWQCGYVIAKGAFRAIQAKGLESFQNQIAGAAPFLGDRAGELDSWDKVKLLTVRVDRLVEWSRPGLLCIGDAAHAMSPVGGVGINLAIQDAVAAANLLAESLRKGPPPIDVLRRVQKRREWPTRVTQGVQVFIHNHVLSRVFAARSVSGNSWFLRLLRRAPFLRRIPARLVGLGVRPEHVRI